MWFTAQYQSTNGRSTPFFSYSGFPEATSKKCRVPWKSTQPRILPSGDNLRVSQDCALMGVDWMHFRSAML